MTDEFKVGIDADLFRSTNDAWNKLMLNDPWSVGYVTSLIESKQWKSKEEWECFYYASGEERNERAGSNYDVIENFQLVKTNKAALYGLSWDIKNLNYQYGRTKEELMQRAKVLYQYMRSQLDSQITIEQCFECVRFRTICETWNGVIIREANTVRRLQYLFGNNISIKKTEGEIDHTYAVDYEVYVDNTLKFGIQIKPKSYFGNAPYLQRARYANQQKFMAYKNKTGCPVFTVTSKTSGEIQNLDVVTEMKKYLMQ